MLLGGLGLLQPRHLISSLHRVVHKLDLCGRTADSIFQTENVHSLNVKICVETFSEIERLSDNYPSLTFIL